MKPSQSDMNQQETGMNCKNCPDKDVCMSPITSWSFANQKESAGTLLRILRCKSGYSRT